MKGREKNMTDIRNIIHRFRMGQSKRKIHHDTGVHRSIIRKWDNLAVTHHWLDPEQPMPSDEEITRAVEKGRKKQIVHPLDVCKDQIRQWHKDGLTSVVIYRLLKGRGMDSCDEQAIRRYRSKHFPKPIEPVMVRQTVAGKHIDLDFGELGYFRDDDDNDKVKKVWLYSLRLRHSRKAYREIVLNQKSPIFLMGHVHAFEFFGGVTENCVLDNTKAAITRSTIDNDMVMRSYQDMAEHYGFIISPCLPYTPEHKGGIEGDVKYVKYNFLQYFLAKQKEMGIAIPRVSALREALKTWSIEVADTHIIHGIGRSPNTLFESEEKTALRPLPKTRWEPTSWSRCVVRREWRVMVECVYYSVPHQLIGEKVDVCVTHTTVRIFHNNKEITLHGRATKKWEYKRKAEHAPPYKEAVLNCTREGLLELAKDIGPCTHDVAFGILSHPTVDKLRPVRHLLGLALKYSKERLELACRRAFNCKLFSYNSVKNILVKNLDSQPSENSDLDKIVPMPTFRFARDPADYKGPIKHNTTRKKTFQEKMEELHPCSRSGNAMLGVSAGLMADQIIEEDKQMHRIE